MFLFSSTYNPGLGLISCHSPWVLHASVFLFLLPQVLTPCISQAGFLQASAAPATRTVSPEANLTRLEEFYCDFSSHSLLKCIHIFWNYIASQLQLLRSVPLLLMLVSLFKTFTRPFLIEWYLDLGTCWAKCPFESVFQKVPLFFSLMILSHFPWT